MDSAPAYDLTDPRCYDPPVERVDVVETHISRIYFAGDRVYKTKKPLRLDFLDYSTLEKRRLYCEEEVRLNRRLAPSVYLGVLPIAIGDDGLASVGGEGEVVDHCVVMRRLPANRMLDARLRAGEVDNDILNRLVTRLVRFHHEAAGGPDVAAFGAPDSLARVALGNVDELSTSLAEIGVSAEERVTALRSALQAFLALHQDLLARRVEERRIREGHGDLHAGNICDLEEGLAIYDCIEFSRAFRCLDVAAEVGFLAMDLDVRRFRGFSGYFVHQYARAADDPELAKLVPFYKVHYALVRAKVAALRTAGADASDRDAALSDVRRYIDLATSYVLPPPLIITCGLPGSGKSHVARALRDPLEATVVRSDVVRKRLVGISPTTHASGAIDRGLYDPAMTDRTYAQLLEEAGAHMGDRPVIVDAAFPSQVRREPFRQLATERSVPFLCLHVTAPESLILARLQARKLDPNEVSDADESVYRAARDRFEAPEELDADQVVVLGGDEADGVGRVLDAALRQWIAAGRSPEVRG